MLRDASTTISTARSLSDTAGRPSIRAVTSSAAQLASRTLTMIEDSSVLPSRLVASATIRFSPISIGTLAAKVPPASFAGTGSEPLTLSSTLSTPVVRRFRKASGSIAGSETRTKPPPVAQAIVSSIVVPLLLDPSNSVWIVMPRFAAATAASYALLSFDIPSVNSMMTRDEPGRP